MLVKELNQMEKIVSENKSLQWDGWDVINLQRSDKARTSKFGVYVNGQWYIQKRIVPTRDGWNLPNKFIG